MLLVQRLEAQSESRSRAGRKVLDQHVRFLEQRLQHLLRLRMLDVKAQALLGAVSPHEVRGHAVDPLVVSAREVAGAGPLDLDHARAKVGELAGAEGRSGRMLQRDGRNAGQGAGHSGYSCQKGRGKPSPCSVTCAEVQLAELAPSREG